MIDFENAANPFQERKETIERWKEKAVVDVEERPDVLNQANEFHALGLRSKDCLHVACAVAARCDYFISTDDALVNRGANVQQIKIRNPLEFVREQLNED